MPIGKNSISRVAGEPVAEPENKVEAPKTVAQNKPAAPKKTTAPKKKHPATDAPFRALSY